MPGGNPTQRQGRPPPAQLPPSRRGGRHPARVTQDRVPLGQGGPAAVPQAPWWPPALPRSRDPPAGRRAPGAADNLSGPAGHVLGGQLATAQQGGTVSGGPHTRCGHADATGQEVAVTTDKSGRTSAGILLWRRRDDRLEVLLAHMGGPHWVNKD